MKRKFISLLCAVAAFAAILIFSYTGAQAKPITPDIRLNFTSYEFDGKIHGPGLKVFDENGNQLEASKDYFVKYNGERVYPGTYSVTVNFIGEYSENEPVTKEFTITESKVDIKLSCTSYEFDGKIHGPGVTVTDSNGNVLVYQKDYVLRYLGERTEPGTYKVRITLQGNYYGTIEKEFTITESKVDIRLSCTSYEFDGKIHGPGVTVTDSNGNVLVYQKDYVLRYLGERTEPGTYKVRITLQGNYRGTIEKEFTITESKVDIRLSCTSYEFDGKIHGPGITVTDKNGNVLVYQKDYVLRYLGERTEPGTYKVRITLQGNYYGTIEKEFTITENKVDIKLSCTSYEFDGKIHGPGVTVTDKNGKVLVYQKDYVLRYLGERTYPGTYKVRITLQGNYRGSIEKEFTITNSRVDIRLSCTSYEFDGKIHGPGVTVTDSKGNVLVYQKDYVLRYLGERTEPGTYKVRITLQGNYYGTYEESFSITENRITVIPNFTSYDYTGTLHGPGVRVYDSKGRLLTQNKDYTVVYGPGRIEPGTYTVYVYLQGNYRGSGSTTFSIVKTINYISIKAAAECPSCTRYTYGESSMGYPLDSFIINGTGRNNRIIFMDCAVHGFEDEYAQDGKVLVTLGNDLVDYYANHPNALGDYRMVIVPCANPDGVQHGKNNYRADKKGAFGRCTYTGVDINRDFRNGSFKAVESRALRNLMNKYKPDVYINFHGWENSVIGDPEIVRIFRAKTGIKTDKSNRYGSDLGYIIGYVKNTYGAHAALVEFKNSRSVNKSDVISAINAIMSNRL